MIKQFAILICLAIITSAASPQVVNVNPDPAGEPWWAGELRPLTAQDSVFLNNLPKMTTPPTLRYRSLPSSVSNNMEPYFRPIFSQEGGSCGQASGMGYCFTYEIDCDRQVAANNLITQYPTHYTWNFLNGGYGGGSWYFDGWMIAQSNGCPNVLDWGGHYAFGGPSRWMSGYSDYYNGMANKVLDIYAIHVGTEQGLEDLKNWLFDHTGEQEPGGLACFAAGVSGTFTMANLPAGTPEAGKKVVVWWDSQVNHAMTIVGYNDSIRYDFNGDGQYTNNLDINNDGLVNMKDWEIGGLKFANSWGLGFGNSGFAYMMYKGIADGVSHGGIWTNTVHVITTRQTYDPFITIKGTVKHTSRNKIRFIAGVSADTSAQEPAHELTFPLFNYQGGSLYMQGGSSEDDKTLEFGLDITPLLSHIVPGEPARYFFRVVETDPFYEGTGEIVSFSLINYINGGDEVVCPQQQVLIAENDTTTLSVCMTVDFDAPYIVTEQLPPAVVNEPYLVEMEASGGTPPYVWDILINYEEYNILGIFPAIEDEQLVPTDNDDGFATKDLEFEFPFYGNTFNHVTLLTDGSIIFEEEFFYLRDEEKLKVSKAITPYGADLMIYPEQNDGMWYSGDDQSATFRWKTSKFEEPGFDVDVAVTLFPDGNIYFYYSESITEGTGWAAGVSKGDGQSYTIASISNSHSIPDYCALKFSPPDYPAGMTISPDGVFSGIPAVDNDSWDITFFITDYLNISATKTLEFTTMHVGMPVQGVENNDIPVLVQPNPFSSETIIRFTLKEDSPVEMNLYNLAGQRIRTLIPDKDMTSGEHLFSWNGTTDDGTPLENGMYYYLLRSRTGSVSGKIILLR